MKSNRLLRKSRLLALVMCQFWIILILVSWVGNAAGIQIGNLLSAEGVRWMFSHALSLSLAQGMLYLLLSTVTVGVCIGSGLASATGEFFRISSTHKILTHKRRRGLYTSFTFIIIWIVGIALLPLLPNSPLLNVIGEFFPSPFIGGFILLFCLGIILAGYSYGILAGTLHTTEEYIAMLEIGPSRYAILFLLYFFVVQIYQTCCYMLYGSYAL